MAKQLRIKKSPIHGLGVFANEFIAKQDVIAVMRVTPIGPEATFATLPHTGIIHNGVVYAVLAGFPLWYVNYSDDPNIEVSDTAVYALKSIAADDELTLRNPETVINAPSDN